MNVAQHVTQRAMRAGEAGNEKGYVVKMTDDNLATPYRIMPGTRVRLESAYDGTSRRTGVMGCAPLVDRSTYHITCTPIWAMEHLHLATA